MRTLVILAILILSSNYANAECTTYMEAFNKHQLVIKGMMDLNFQGKMNSQVGDSIGKRLQEAQDPLDSGDYKKACGIYDSIIDDYGFEKSFGDAPTEEADKGSSGNSTNDADATSSANPSPAKE